MNQPEVKPLSLCISATRRVNLGNYESADVFLSISNVTEQTTQEEIDALLNGNGKIAYSSLTRALQEKALVAKQGASAT